MAQLLVRDIGDDVKERLRERAREHGRSMEAEARDILREALGAVPRPAGGLGTEIAALFRGKGFKKGEIKELRGYRIQPAKFDE